MVGLGGRVVARSDQDAGPLASQVAQNAKEAVLERPGARLDLAIEQVAEFARDIRRLLVGDLDHPQRSLRGQRPGLVEAGRIRYNLRR